MSHAGRLVGFPRFCGTLPISGKEGQRVRQAAYARRQPAHTSIDRLHIRYVRQLDRAELGLKGITIPPTNAIHSFKSRDR